MESKLKDLEIFVGAHDAHLLTYKVLQVIVVNQDLISVPQFILKCVNTQQPHRSAITCIQSSGKFLVTGGMDSLIVIIDLNKKHEISKVLTHHSATVNQVRFSPDGKYLLTTSNDCLMALLKTSNWTVDTVWFSPHTNRPITYVSLHPSGLFATSLGSDYTLNTWSLILKIHYQKTELVDLLPNGKTISRVDWNSNGDLFTLAAIDSVVIVSLDGIVKEIPSDSRTISVCWADAEHVLLGQINGKIKFVQVYGDKEMIVQAHSLRVKEMAILHGFLVTLSRSNTNGEMSVWEVSIQETSLKLLCTTTIDRRPTCLTLVDTCQYHVPELIKNDITYDYDVIYAVPVSTAVLNVKPAESPLPKIDYPIPDANKKQSTKKDLITPNPPKLLPMPDTRKAEGDLSTPSTLVSLSQGSSSLKSRHKNSSGTSIHYYLKKLSSKKKKKKKKKKKPYRWTDSSTDDDFEETVKKKPPVCNLLYTSYDKVLMAKKKKQALKADQLSQRIQPIAKTCATWGI